MYRAPSTAFLLLFIAHQASSDSASPQIGARASGLGGAFTAVANDSTAFYWNPAGVVYGKLIRVGFYGGSNFQDRGELINRLRFGEPGSRSQLDGDDALGFSASFTVFGFAFTRFTHTTTVLQDDVLISRGLETTDLALTLVQSLPLDDLTVGANLHYMRGTAFERATKATNVPPGKRNVRDLVELATEGDGPSEGEFGLDLGLLYQPADWVRLGLTARNLTEPSFHTENNTELTLERHSRAGVAFMLSSGYLLAVDFDLTSRDVAAGADSWRELALGAEKSWGGGRITVRGGVRTELPGGGAERPGVSVGLGVDLGKVVVDVGVMSSTRRKLGGIWLGLSLNR